MFVELTSSFDGGKVLINPEKVSVVCGETQKEFAYVIVGETADIKINVKESFEEIKKRLGLAITPRAERLAAF